jgi:nucleoside-diphosphate-sugar epimerase
VQNTLIILGSGYTARFLLPLAARHYATVLATSRDPDKNLSHLSRDQRLRFDLAQPDTWTALPDNADILWSFPAAPLNLVQQYSERLRTSSCRLVILGSTSAYETGGSQGYPPPWIDETAPTDGTKPRVQGEDYLRTTLGAIVLRVAGIYGPGRNPLNWIRTGRVSSSRKYVNLIHVEDLASICLLALERGTLGEIYNVSDGTPHTWREICDYAQCQRGIAPPLSVVDREPGKRISIKKLTQNLGYQIHHHDLYEELSLL